MKKKARALESIHRFTEEESEMLDCYLVFCRLAQQQIASLLHISEADLRDILAGRRVVDHLVYWDPTQPGADAPTKPPVYLELHREED